MANTSLRREVSVTGNRKIFTFSAWVKKTKIADNQNIFSQYVGSGSANIGTHFRIRFQTTDALAVATGGTDMLLTNAVYRDTNAWMHVVCAVDTTQSTADDRIKLYVNGEQITSFASRNNPSQNVDTVVNLAGSSHYPRIGADDSDGAEIVNNVPLKLPAKVPNEPAPVLNVGAVDAVIIAFVLLAALPSFNSIRT